MNLKKSEKEFMAISAVYASPPAPGHKGIWDNLADMDSTVG